MRGFTFALVAFASQVAADGHTAEDQMAAAMADLDAAMQEAMRNGTMPMDMDMDGNQTMMSQNETIQWVLDTFVAEEDHEMVRYQLNEVVEKVDQFEDDANELVAAAVKTQESGQKLVDTVQELFMQDAATYVQAGAAAFAAVTLATAI